MISLEETEILGEFRYGEVLVLEAFGLNTGRLVMLAFPQNAECCQFAIESSLQACYRPMRPTLTLIGK